MAVARGAKLLNCRRARIIYPTITYSASALKELSSVFIIKIASSYWLDAVEMYADLQSRSEGVNVAHQPYTQYRGWSALQASRYMYIQWTFVFFS